MGMELRKSIIDLIKLISSSQGQFEYEKNVPIANVPSELICMWFDDFYHPASQLFISSFSTDEKEALSMFNEFYDSRVKEVPINGGVAALQNNKQWIEIQAYAKALVNKYNW